MPRGRGHKHLRFIQRLLSVPHLSQKSLHTGTHINVTAGKVDMSGFKIHLIPSKRCNLAGLHRQLPTHPNSKARCRASFQLVFYNSLGIILLDDPPKQILNLIFSTGNSKILILFPL